jgi:nitrite reductase/ring-hydroxylating ferredoxin subunit
MGHGYTAVGWNRQKRIYDGLMLGGVAVYLALFTGAELVVHPAATAETALIRALGTCAFLVLHVILSIGPLARLDARFLPLLYNRRHLGVTMFLIAAAHGTFSIVQFHALSDLNPFVSALASDGSFTSGLAAFPFQPLGVAALAILFLMAATSHDFWLANLTAPVWKTLHMLVYAAYALLVAHVALGALQAETSPVPLVVVAAGLAWVLGVHGAAAWRGRTADRERRELAASGWIDAGAVASIPEKRAIQAVISGETVAIFRYDGRVSAISGICRHQNGPLAEGRIVDGCVTCPWHGYQYLPDSGASPPPFDEKVPTFDVRVMEGRIWVNPVPHPPGTRLEPAVDPAPPAVRVDAAPPFYVGYLPSAPDAIAATVRRSVLVLGVAVVALPLVLVGAQNPFAPSRFDFGHPRTYEGTVHEHPYPALDVVEDGTVGAYALVGPGKHGAGTLVGGLDGAAVHLEGMRIERKGRSMLEIVPGSIRRLDGTTTPGREGATDLGTVTLQGEIVDSKCFLGVMNPGSTKIHRACAVRCISGGAPPILFARDREGAEAYLYLTGADGRPLNREVLALVALPVEVTGRVFRLGGRFTLRAEPTSIRVLK